MPPGDRLDPCEAPEIAAALRRGYTFAVRFVALLAVTFAASSAAAEGRAPVVVVFSIQDTRADDRLTEAALSELTSYLSVRLAEGGMYRLTPPAQVREALTNKKAESFKACFDETCQIELGKALAAEKSLGTKIIRVDSRTCAITSTLYDLKTEVTERAATAEGACDRDAIAGSLRAAVAKLRGESIAALASSPLPAASSVGKPAPPAGTEACRTFAIRDPRDRGSNLRTTPNARRRNVIQELPNGTRVTALGRKGRWVRVRVEGSRLMGFVHRTRLVKACP